MDTCVYLSLAFLAGTVKVLPDGTCPSGGIRKEHFWNDFPGVMITGLKCVCVCMCARVHVSAGMCMCTCMCTQCVLGRGMCMLMRTPAEVRGIRCSSS